MPHFFFFPKHFYPGLYFSPQVETDCRTPSTAPLNTAFSNPLCPETQLQLLVERQEGHWGKFTWIRYPKEHLQHCVARCSQQKSSLSPNQHHCTNRRQKSPSYPCVPPQICHGSSGSQTLRKRQRTTPWVGNTREHNASLHGKEPRGIHLKNVFYAICLLYSPRP